MKNTISFDFDNTLLLWDFDENNGWMPIGPINTMINTLKMFAYSNKIIILSSRCNNDKQDILDFIEKYNLPVDHIFCIGDDEIDKGEKLEQIGDVILHIDDQDRKYEDKKRIFSLDCS